MTDDRITIEQQIKVLMRVYRAAKNAMSTKSDIKKVFAAIVELREAIKEADDVAIDGEATQ